MTPRLMKPLAVAAALLLGVGLPGAQAAARIELAARQTHGFNIRLEIKIFDKPLGLEQKPIELTLQGYEVKDPAEKSWYHMSGNLRPISSWAGAAWEVGMPTMDAYDKPFEIKVDGQPYATVKPTIDTRVFQWLDQRVQQIQVVFEPAVLTSSKLPAPRIADEAMVQQLLGESTIEDVKYIDATGAYVTSISKPGRHGGIATLKSKKGKEIKCYKTLFRLPQGYTPEGSDAEKAQIKAALEAGDKGHETAALLAAARDRENNEDPWVLPDNVAHRDKRWWMKIRGRVLDEPLSAFYTYRPHLPPDYNADRTKLWPMILYLHGGGLGDQGAYLSRGALGFMFGGQGPEKFVKISPFCYNGDWDNNHLNDFLDTVECQFRVDENKIYLVGHSAGGYAAIHFSKNYPRRFAAVAPCAAAGQSIIPGEAETYKANNVAVWLFVGEQDGRPLAGADVSFQSLMSVGANGRYSRLPGWGHGSDHYAIRGGCPELYEWFLSLDRRRPAVHPDDTEQGQWVARNKTGVLEGPKADDSWKTMVGGAAVSGGYKWFEVYHKLEPPPLVKEARKRTGSATSALKRVPRNAETRTWTAASGKQVEATLVAVEGEKAILRLADGKKASIALGGLSEQDQQYIERVVGE